MLPLGASVSFPPFPEQREEDEGTPQGAAKTQEVHPKCGNRGASRPSGPAASLASPGLCLSPAPTLPGTFSLCPTPICMPSCQHWQVSQARLPPSLPCARWGKGLEPGAVLLGEGQGQGLGLEESGRWAQREAILSQGPRVLEKGAKPAPLTPPAHFLSPRSVNVFNEQTHA